MKESSWGYGIIFLGLIVLTVMMLAQNLTTTNEEDFYLGREVLSASMIDAVDLGTYRNSGKLVMSKERFVEIFLKRFAESVSATKTYQIDFYDIREYPPKASVRVRTMSNNVAVGEDSFEVSLDTLLSGVLETVTDISVYEDASAGLYCAQSGVCF